MKIVPVLWKNDWCHLCGKRDRHKVNIFYPRNAEHKETPLVSNIRVCSRCLQIALDVIETAAIAEKHNALH